METLAAKGLTASDAVQLLLMRIAADKALLFAIQASNAKTLAAMAEADDKSHHARSATAEELIDDLGEASGN